MPKEIIMNGENNDVEKQCPYEEEPQGFWQGGFSVQTQRILLILCAATCVLFVVFWGMWQFGDHGNVKIQKLKEQVSDLESKLSKTQNYAKQAVGQLNSGDVNPLLRNYMADAIKAVDARVQKEKVGEKGSFGKDLSELFQNLPVFQNTTPYIRTEKTKRRKNGPESPEEEVSRKVLYVQTQKGLEKPPQALILSIYLRTLAATESSWADFVKLGAATLGLGYMVAQEHDLKLAGYGGRIKGCDEHPILAQVNPDWAQFGAKEEVKCTSDQPEAECKAAPAVEGYRFLWTTIFTIFITAVVYCFWEKISKKCCTKAASKK